MRFRSVRAVAALALVLGVLGTSNSGAVRPEPVSDAVLITPVWTPLGVSEAPVTVVVQLAGDSVAVQQANAGRKLNREEKDGIKRQLRSQQHGLRGSIESLGGTVLGGYQASYNGIKVRIARDRAKELASLPGVVAVRPLQLMRRDNTASVTPDNIRGVSLIGTPAVWQSVGLHGEGVKVAIIDTGIDYTHATFGGPGTAAAFTAARATSTLPLPANSTLFGPRAPRVKGGIDLVGDRYNPEDPVPANQVPHPDPNPLDCDGHGSHVAATAAGSGVTAAGTTYTGPYNASTIATPANWAVGPGVAPKADIYAIRVFGCNGPTDVVVDAIEWAVDNDMDVINMSLGSAFGSKDDPSAVASTNAAKAGVIVVAAAGNSGPNQYITGSPATAEGAISVAANDPWPTLPGATITLPTGGPITAINANGYLFSMPLGFTIRVITNDPTTPTRDESLGCSVDDFGSLSPNTIAVVNRGVCARVAKAIFGQQAGAAAVVMVNNVTGLPPFEGTITSNPDDGIPFNVTIPFLGVRGLPTTPSSDGGRLRASDGFATTVAAVDIPNTNFTGFASFSSGGPRIGGLRHRQRTGDDLRHIHGLAARRGCRCAHASGASELESRGHPGCDGQHRASVRRARRARLPGEPRRDWPGPAGGRYGDARGCAGGRRAIRHLPELRIRGVQAQLQQDQGDRSAQPWIFGGDLQHRAGACLRQPAHRQFQPGVGESSGARRSEGQGDA
jgi:minor extracellular serine protease Vpr